MLDPDETFVVHECWSYERPRKLLRVYLGRYVRLPPASFTFQTLIRE
jgi:hypothetical protein